MNRRTFLGVAGAGTLSALAFSVEDALAQGSEPPLLPMSFAGDDLSRWETVVGDGIFARPGVNPVARSDIATLDYGNHSSLVVNVSERPVMAHSIAFRRITDDTLFDYAHVCSYEFRMPNLETSVQSGTRAQTVEGGLFIWDGGGTRRDYGLGFQWVLNPEDPKYRAIQTWSMSNAAWRSTGSLEPDNEWHRFEASIDHKRNRARIYIDGNEVSAAYTRRPKPSYWGTETAARLQVEAISLDPGAANSAPMHTVDVRNWSWDCTPA